MTGAVLNLPTELRDPFFFTDEKVKMGSQIVPSNPYFAFEILFYSGARLHSLPWLVQGQWIDDIVGGWREEEVYLKSLFKSRSKETTLAMKKGIAQFYMFLFWSNNQPVNLENWGSKVDRLPVKPVNAVERLTFIRENASLFHSYIQLAQLFEEQHKQYAKFLALNQAAKK
ncbi:hypothetical protein CN378_01825 [Bacillus sp. AFS015802]|uniref:YpoC family protein n=1 Tax=Bacillus sp. AFS015802 TaxID=2033486 RepID=UPI000BF7879C|nr:hypothetical protein [Bacillus sp. AFS015802]PFA70068.1 hypothetical protein CN378_01825 [Bacillus sp. AFS015802]